MRITESARKHGITDAEIVAVIGHPIIRIELKARVDGALPVLHIGALDVDEPHIEVIVDMAPGEPVVFHAMMLRPALVVNLGIEDLFAPNYARQRR